MSNNTTIGCAWELSAVSAPATESLNNDINIDVAIIGAGYTGLTSALHLADSDANIAVIDSHSIGWGASGRNGGHVVPLIRIDPDSIIAKLGQAQGEKLIAAVKDSANEVFSLIRKFKLDCDAEQVGWLQPSHSDKQVEIAKKRAEQWQKHGADVDYLSLSKISSLLGSNAYKGGFIAHTGGHINPLSYVRELARVAMANGVQVYTNTPALDIQKSGSNWLIKTANATITANKIIIATAAYSDSIWPGLKQSIIPFQLYSIATKPLSEKIRASVIPDRQPMTDSRGDARVFHYDKEGRLLVGGTFIFPIAWQKRLPIHANKLLADTFPQIEEPEYEMTHIWKGSIAMTADVLPHLHRLTPGVFSWLGCNARGIALSTMMGKSLAKMVTDTDEDLPLLPTEPNKIRFHRFNSLMTSSSLAFYRLRDKLDS